MQETLKIKSETKKIRVERERMNEELLQKKREHFHCSPEGTDFCTD